MSGDQSDEYPPAVADRWEAVLDDANATADEYREDGWDVLVLHPGDVTPLTDDPVGLDVLVPDDEFEALEQLVEQAQFAETRVFRAEDGGVRFYVIAAEAPGEEQVVLLPAFLTLEAASALRQVVSDDGGLSTLVRTLAGDRRVSIEHEDPSPFFE